MSESCPYKSIMIAAGHGRGVRLTAEQAHLLAMDTAIVDAAFNRLSPEDQALEQTMNHWAFWRRFSRSRAPSPTPKVETNVAYWKLRATTAEADLRNMPPADHELAGWFNPWNEVHGYQQVAKEFEGKTGTIPLYTSQPPAPKMIVVSTTDVDHNGEHIEAVIPESEWAGTSATELEPSVRQALEALYRCGQKQGWHNGAYEIEMEMARSALDK